MPKRTANPIPRALTRVQASLAKRLFWRQHLVEAQDTMEAMKRELPTIEMLMTVPLHFRGKGYFRSLELKQNMTELLGLVNRLRERPLRRVCEIGTFKGGTLFIWCQLAEPEARLYSLDLPGGPFGGGYHERSLPFFQSLRKPGQTLECLRGNSHDESLRSALERSLSGAKLDFLFIDGDHTYAGVKQDFAMYSPLVAPGGFIAFHDIVPRPDVPSIEVWKFWQELKAQHADHQEWVNQSTQGRRIGIGLLRWAG
jgi:predicted O-methyltransferase YrrM